MVMPPPSKTGNCRTYHFAHGVNLGEEIARFGNKVCNHILLYAMIIHLSPNVLYQIR